MLVGQRAFPSVFGPNRAACPLFWSIALVEKVGEDFLVGIQDLVSGHTELECELDAEQHCIVERQQQRHDDAEHHAEVAQAAEMRATALARTAAEKAEAAAQRRAARAARAQRKAAAPGGVGGLAG